MGYAPSALTHPTTSPSKRDNPEFDHTGFVFIVGPDGKYIGYLPPGTPAERVIETLRPHLPSVPQG